VIEIARTILKNIFAVAFGSEAGNFGYPIAARPSLTMVAIGLIVLVGVLAAVRFSLPRLRTHEARVVGLWLVVACAAHIAFAQLAYARQSVVIESDAANGFYAVSQKYSAGEFLARFHELVGTFTTHSRANLPGKILLYEGLELVTNSPQGLAYLIILLSNLGGLLVYALARQWFQDPLTALYALVLYLFLPARIYFFPLLNTVSPVLMLLVFWLVTRYVTSRRRSDLLSAGVALFALTIFDPLPLVAMPIAAVIVLKQVMDGRLTWASVAGMAGWIAASFALVYLMMRFAFGFDLIEGFRFTITDAREFNIRSNRPYSIWVVHNLKDFFLNVGIAQSLVFAAFVGFIVRRLTAERDAIRQTDVLLTLMFLAVLFGLDLAGVNRGESVRLWIFLGVLMQLLVARALAIWSQRRLFVPVLSVSILQTALCITIVAWIIP
jgi:methylthioxylose transferase